MTRFCLTGLLLLVCSCLYGQVSYQQAGIDSAAIQTKINQGYKNLDSTQKSAAAKRSLDSLKRVNEKIRLQQYRDSVIQAQKAKRIADSLARVEAKNKLIQERKTRDSLAAVQRQRTIDSIAYVRFKADSTQKKQKLINDSLMARRKFVLDSTKNARANNKKMREALAKYKNSKRYKDSLNARKLARIDSIKNERAAKNALIKAEQKRIRDSVSMAQHAYNDSLLANNKRIRDSSLNAQKEITRQFKEARAKYNDSLKVVRTKIQDSLKIVREARAKKLAGKGKESSKDKKDLKLSIALHEKKTEEWTNEKLLKRSWSITRRIYQNTVTRYNAYYHAKRKYDESVLNATKAHKEDYIKPIHIFPFDVEKAGNTVSGNMDSVIKKASYSTQIHDPRSKWFDDLYLLMAKAYYMKNDFDNAITTCQFIINEYKEVPDKKVKRSIDTSASIATKEKGRKLLNLLKHKPIRNKSILLLVNSYVLTEQFGEAQTMIALLEKDKVLPKKYLPELMLAKTNLAMKQKNDEDAIAALEAGLKNKMPELQKSRAQFLLAQLYAKNKKYDKSTANYKKAFYKKNAPEMDFFTKLHIAENAANGGGDLNYAMNQLHKIIKDPKYTKFKSQALITLARIQKQENQENAIETLLKSIKDKDNKDLKVKSQAYAELGDIYYNNGRYVDAKMSYDSAIEYSSSAPIDNILEITFKRNVLFDIVQFVNTIHEQDSLLILSNMSEKDRKAIVKKQIDRQNEEIKKKQLAKVETLKPINKSDPNAIISNWYFGNKDLMEQGAKDFKLKWGNRKLTDNWRRSDANALSLTENNANGEDMGNELSVAGVAELWNKIPNSPAQRDSCHEKIMNAYYGLGLAYYAQLEDYQQSIVTFDTLLSKYSRTKFKPEVYYGQFLNYSKLQNEAKANYYRDLLQKEYPTSELAQLTLNADILKDKAKAIQQKYEATYTLYKEKKYQDVLTAAGQVDNTNPLLAKYKLIEALSHGGLKDIGKCKSGLMAVISQFPESAEQKKAQEILSYITQIELSGDSVNSGKGKDSVAKLDIIQSSEGKGSFNFNPEEEHYALIYLKNADNQTIAFKAGISDYNLLKYNVEEYTTGLNFITTTQGMITVKSFNNQQSAKKYINDMRKEKLLFSKMKSSDYELMVVSKSNFIEILKSHDVMGYITFYNKNYK